MYSLTNFLSLKSQGSVNGCFKLLYSNILFLDTVTSEEFDAQDKDDFWILQDSFCERKVLRTCYHQTTEIPRTVNLPVIVSPQGTPCILNPSDTGLSIPDFNNETRDKEDELLRDPFLPQPPLPFGSSVASLVDAFIASITAPNPIPVAVSVVPDLAPPTVPPATTLPDLELVAHTL